MQFKFITNVNLCLPYVVSLITNCYGCQTSQYATWCVLDKITKSKANSLKLASLLLSSAAFSQHESRTLYQASFWKALCCNCSLSEDWLSDGIHAEIWIWKWDWFIQSTQQIYTEFNWQQGWNHYRVSDGGDDFKMKICLTMRLSYHD